LSSAPTLTLLGPQRLEPTLAAAVARLGIQGRIAAVTAGWQEREAEIDEMRAHLNSPVVDLALHRRCEQVFAGDPELFRAHRARQDRLREMHRLYRYRLEFTRKPALGLLRREGADEVLEPEREAAIEALRDLDRQYLRRIAEVHHAFDQANPAGSHPALERQRDEVAELLRDSAALGVAGGHVAVLINRLRLFRFAELAAGKRIIAWSAGAMALAERIVLFHDNPPQGAGNAEVLDHGLGLYSGLLPLPHARRRLRLDDTCRVELLVRRFAPDICLPLDDGDEITLETGRRKRQTHLRSFGAVSHLRATGATPARRLTTDGRVEELAA